MYVKKYFFIKEMTILFYNLNSNVKFLRKYHKMSQPELAKKLKISTMSLSNFEGGSVNTSLEILDKLHTLFNISLDDLVYKDLSSSEE